MKSIFVTFALMALAAADVSHLNNMYLPPKGALDVAATEQHHHQSQYAEQSIDIPAAIGADTYTPEHLIEPSNNLAVEVSHPQPIHPGSNIYPRLQDVDIRIDDAATVHAPVEAPQETPQHQDIAVEERFAEASQHIEQQDVEQHHEEQPAAAESQHFPQPAATQDFVPQTYGADIIYSPLVDGLLGQQTEEHYDTAASSSSSAGIDTQYGSNGGYVY